MFSFSSALERQNAFLYLWDIILRYIMLVSSNIGYIGFIFLKQNWVLRAHISYFAQLYPISFFLIVIYFYSCRVDVVHHISGKIQ